VSTCLYFSWVYPSLHVPIRIYKAWHGSQRRIIVFGDSFSDTGTYAIYPPDVDLIPIRDPDEGKRWTEVLCDEIVCDSLENFARSWPYPEGNPRFGAVIHNDLYRGATLEANVTYLTDEQLLPDLGLQVQQWIKCEQKRNYHDAEEDDEIVFTVFFGSWDVWQFALLNRENAQAAITESINWLFNQLDIIAAHSPSQARFVVPEVWDMTFTPRFRRSLTSQERAAFLSQEGHKLVWMIKFWNLELIQRARTWENGEIYVPDTDGWLVQKIRHQQLFNLGITNSTGVGVGAPEFVDVSNPCLRASHIPPNETSDSSADETVVIHPCEAPEKYLFWSDTSGHTLQHK
jgi:hypothetical protein